MTLLVTVIAAIISTVIWYMNENRDAYKLGTLTLIYWGASLMWFVDFVAEYIELRSDYFVQGFSDILNDAILGVTAVAIGLIAWIVILLFKDPKGVFKKKFTKQ